MGISLNPMDAVTETPTSGDAAIDRVREKISQLPSLPAEVIGGILRERQFGLLCGYYGIGKSPLVTDLAFHVANGLEWLGRLTKQRPVIVVDYETPPEQYCRNMIRISERYPGQHLQPTSHLLLSKESGCCGVTSLGIMGQSDWRERLEFVRSCFRESPDALIIVDPVEHFFHFNRNKSAHIFRLYGQLRELLNEYPHGAMVFVTNLRRRADRRNRPNLLKDPLSWLEDNAGNLDLLNRCDVRLGFDAHDDPDQLVIHGSRRGEEMQPILVRRIGTRPDLAGFELVQPQRVSLERRLTQKQRDYWNQLPTEFRFEEIVAAGTVPRSTLSRLTNIGRSMGLLESSEGVYRKK